VAAVDVDLEGGTDDYLPLEFTREFLKAEDEVRSSRARVAIPNYEEAQISKEQPFRNEELGAESEAQKR
jgi:hypothetical protein